MTKKVKIQFYIDKEVLDRLYKKPFNKYVQSDSELARNCCLHVDETVLSITRK
jgi:hypothetical protein